MWRQIRGVCSQGSLQGLERSVGRGGRDRRSGVRAATAILWKAYIPMQGEAVQTGDKTMGGRVARATLCWRGLRKIQLYSVYLETGGRLGDLNLQVLSMLAAEVCCSGVEALMDGDWRVEPEALNEAGWPDCIGGSVWSDDVGAGTCIITSPASTIDSFVVRRK